MTIENKLKIYKAFSAILSTLCCTMVLFIIFTKKTSQNEDMGHLEPIKVDSVIITDTLYVEIPKTLIEYREITKVESVFVEVPVTQEKIPFLQKHYQDSIADIYISGFQPSLDSIHYHLPKQTIYVDRTIEVPKTKKWWEDRFIFSAGVYTGYSPIYNNFDVIVGFGVGVRLGR